MIRLLLIIRSLNQGGAERQLVELVRGLDKSRFAVTVATFYDGGKLRPELERFERVKVCSLHKKGRWDILPFLFRLERLVLQLRPHIIYASMGVSNELGLLAGRTVGARVAWGLRASNVDFSRYGWASQWSFRVGAWLSRFADLIIANSYAGKQHQIAQGYHGKRMIVIPNGIDTGRFYPDREGGRRLREEWRIEDGRALIGLVGRLDPMKDHPTFLRAATLLRKERPHVRFVCVGDGPEAYSRELAALAEALDLSEHLIWAGARSGSDMPSVYSALDIACSSSSDGEGTSNAIAEAMACEVPCVVTCVGDAARLVGKSEQIVPPRNPAALSAALQRLLDLPCEQRAAIGKEAREHIVKEYSVTLLASRTESALINLLR